jgi:hypothetical protein
LQTYRLALALRVLIAKLATADFSDQRYRSTGVLDAPRPSRISLNVLGGRFA